MADTTLTATLLDVPNAVRPADFVASLNRGDRLWAQDGGGVVDYVQTEGIADPDTLALVWFTQDVNRSNRSVLRISRTGYATWGGEWARSVGNVYSHEPGFADKHNIRMPRALSPQEWDDERNAYRAPVDWAELEREAREHPEPGY